MLTSPLNPGPDLYLRVRIGFISQGTTLAAWCKERSIYPTNAKSAIVGVWDGPKARELRDQIVQAAQLARRKKTAA